MKLRPVWIAAAVTIGSIVTPTMHLAATDGEVLAANDPVAPTSARPHVLDDAFAEVLVRLGVCSGTPIEGTVYVVTAAHCVLTQTGEITKRTIVRDDVRYSPVAVLVDTDYHDHRSVQLDAAVLIMGQVLPGPAAQLGKVLPDSGYLTLAGYQPLDSDGSPLRGHHVNERPLPKGATGTRIVVPYEPAGCAAPVSELVVAAVRVTVSCGLVPGASGGGLYAEQDGEVVLVGIVSTVTADLSANGVVPLNSLHELLRHPDQYRHDFSTEHAQRQRTLRELT
jgi:hypothetical protein